MLRSSFGKTGNSLGLLSKRVDIEDLTASSKYFYVTEFNPTFAAGKNAFAFNGSNLLKPNSEIEIECIDANNNSLYIELPSDSLQFIDVSKYIVSIHVYNEIVSGPGKLILIGTTAKNEIVRWVGSIIIDTLLSNNSKPRLYFTPELSITPILYPVISPSEAVNSNVTLTLSGSIYSYSVIPTSPTSKYAINSKRNEIDYRIVLLNPHTGSNTLIQTGSFNSQMEGYPISINIYDSNFSNFPSLNTQSCLIHKIINHSSLKLSEPLYINNGYDNLITNVNNGNCNISYRWTYYNTGSQVYQKFNTTYIKELYAEVIFRNLDTYTGILSKYKLYRRSLLYPGDFELIADKYINNLELLSDALTVNKFFSNLGYFYNQFHTEKYCLTSSNNISLIQSHYPLINAVKISSSNYTNVDGNQYVIIKTSALNTDNDNTYYPYSEINYINQSGSSYTSNFIHLVKNTLYELSYDTVIYKDASDTTAKLEFFFTSSIPSITNEVEYSSKYGMQMGKLEIPDITDIKTYSKRQSHYFTAHNDYYGTVIIVPYNCNPLISNLSLRAYEDHGFSSNSSITRIPFKINVANEPFQFKAELYDSKLNLIESNITTVQAFDPAGESLFLYIGASNFDPSLQTQLSGSLTITGSLYLPNLQNCPQENTRLVAWHEPLNAPPGAGEGALCATNISKITITGSISDYIQINMLSGSLLTEIDARSIAVKYTPTEGRRIFVNSGGIKTIYQ